MKNKKILSIFVLILSFTIFFPNISHAYKPEILNLVVQKAKKDEKFKFIITEYLSEIEISIMLGLKQGFIDLQNPKKSISELLELKLGELNKYFDNLDNNEKLIREFFNLVRDASLVIKK